MLVSTISGRPGTLRDFINSALPTGIDLNITELRHRRASTPQRPETDISSYTLPLHCCFQLSDIVSCVWPSSHAGSATAL